jgi:hypothetical protein
MLFKYRCAEASMLLLLGVACHVPGVFAQQTDPMITPPTAATAESQTLQASLESIPPAIAAPVDCCTLLDGSPVELEIADVLNTMTLKRGDRFRIRLHAPVSVAEGIVLPAGVEGVGEVVHVEPGRASGKAAELILAARYLDHLGKQVKLRGMKLSTSGSNRTGMVAGVSIAISVFAAFIHGGNIEIPAGTVVSAKIGETLQLPLISTPTSSMGGTGDDTGHPDVSRTSMERPDQRENIPSA